MDLAPVITFWPWLLIKKNLWDSDCVSVVVKGRWMDVVYVLTALTSLTKVNVHGF